MDRMKAAAAKEALTKKTKSEIQKCASEGRVFLSPSKTTKAEASFFSSLKKKELIDLLVKEAPAQAEFLKS